VLRIHGRLLAPFAVPGTRTRRPGLRAFRAGACVLDSAQFGVSRGRRHSRGLLQGGGFSRRFLALFLPWLFSSPLLHYVKKMWRVGPIAFAFNGHFPELSPELSPELYRLVTMKGHKWVGAERGCDHYRDGLPRVLPWHDDVMFGRVFCGHGYVPS
jgi:hypothetical protein